MANIIEVLEKQPILLWTWTRSHKAAGRKKFSLFIKSATIHITDIGKHIIEFKDPFNNNKKIKIRRYPASYKVLDLTKPGCNIPGFEGFSKKAPRWKPRLKFSVRKVFNCWTTRETQQPPVPLLSTSVATGYQRPINILGNTVFNELNPAAGRFIGAFDIRCSIGILNEPDPYMPGALSSLANAIIYAYPVLFGMAVTGRTDSTRTSREAMLFLSGHNRMRLEIKVINTSKLCELN